MGDEYPSLIRVPRHGKKKVLLSKFDYISMAEESDFYITELTADEKESMYFD